MTTDEYGPGAAERRLTPADVQNVRFSRAPMLHPGYNDAEVDRFLVRMAGELAHLHAENADLRDHVHDLEAQVHALHDQLASATAVEPPSEQAVRILATAQQTADSYVAEAEDFSRQMTTDARAQYEEQVRRARENAGAIIQAAQEAAARMVAGGQPAPATEDGGERTTTTQDLEEQVAYLKAFAQACRVQLRSYLEALLTDVETEWGRADPASLQQLPLRTPAERPAVTAGPPVPTNVAREVPLDDSTSEQPAVGTGGSAEVTGRRT
ncbi:DivIVA domain-containing protein [Geodermatophilus sp. SYSU D00742]